MARPKIHESQAARQKHYATKKKIVRVTLMAKRVNTLDNIAIDLDRTRAELLESMVRFVVEKLDPDTVAYACEVYDSRVDGETKRADVPMPDGITAKPYQVAGWISLALTNRQWSRFGLY